VILHGQKEQIKTQNRINNNNNKKISSLPPTTKTTNANNGLSLQIWMSKTAPKTTTADYSTVLCFYSPSTQYKALTTFRCSPFNTHLTAIAS
jgi:hypothetical protein